MALNIVRHDITKIKADAIGGAIEQIVGIHSYASEEEIPEHTVYIITTDGMENA